MLVEILLDDKETTAMQELCEAKGMSAAAVFRQSLRLYQSVHLGVHNLVENPDHPLNQLPRGCGGDD